ncbi:nuclear transport factor 2 family protein, partial [Candidatus Poribacteria bacterium]
QDIEALDPERIPSIKSCFSEDYIAANDQATFIGVVAGVVPADFQVLPDAILNIVEKYSKIEFKFADPDVELDEDTATVLMRFEVYAETREPAEKWEVIVNGQLDLRKEDGDWRITYWRLIPDFIKFEKEPLG